MLMSKPYLIMKKGRTTVAIHNHDATPFIYVKVPALVVLAGDAVVVAIEPMWIGGMPPIGNEKALCLGLAAKIGAIPVASSAADGDRC